MEDELIALQKGCQYRQLINCTYRIVNADATNTVAHLNFCFRIL